MTERSFNALVFLFTLGVYICYLQNDELSLLVVKRGLRWKNTENTQPFFCSQDIQFSSFINNKHFNHTVYFHFNLN